MDLLHIIGFKVENSIDNSNEEKLLKAIIEIRDLVRKNKMYNISDQIRDHILPKYGYELQDVQNGSKIKRI